MKRTALLTVLVFLVMLLLAGCPGKIEKLLVVTGIEIVEQPDTLSYAPGQTLDLSGLIVRLTWSHCCTEDVEFASFAEKDLVTEPANGAVLSEDHHEKPVVITHTPSGETADTDDLQVALVGTTPRQPTTIEFAGGGSQWDEDKGQWTSFIYLWLKDQYGDGIGHNALQEMPGKALWDYRGYLMEDAYVVHDGCGWLSPHFVFEGLHVIYYDNVKVGNPYANVGHSWTVTATFETREGHPYVSQEFEILLLYTDQYRDYIVSSDDHGHNYWYRVVIQGVRPVDTE